MRIYEHYMQRGSLISKEQEVNGRTLFKFVGQHFSYRMAQNVNNKME